ncbi:MAG: hypothetical protein JWO67_1233 [Streptosporangiaceae bacterium]|nr:hypothetical protein [Streptosporangiaceae bacterium]
MSIQRSSRVALRRPLGWTLFFLALLTGLLAMHGLQASASPTDTSGIPTDLARGTAAMTGHSRHEPDSTANDPSQPAPPHKSHSGQVCLGLLVLASLLSPLTPVRWHRYTLRSVPIGLPIAPGRARGGRPPPSVFALSVLRL